MDKKIVQFSEDFSFHRTSVFRQFGLDRFYCNNKIFHATFSVYFFQLAKTVNGTEDPFCCFGTPVQIHNHNTIALVSSTPTALILQSHLLPFPRTLRPHCVQHNTRKFPQYRQHFFILLLFL